MIFDGDDIETTELNSAVRCPFCSAHLMFKQTGSDPRNDDIVFCDYHGLVGTRQSVLQAVKANDLHTIHEALHIKQGHSVVHLGQLTYDQIKTLVKAHNKSGQPDELIIAIAWNESNFMPGGQNPKGSAGGLLGLTRAALNDLRHSNEISAPFDVHNPVDNITAGSLYLALRIRRAHGNLTHALDEYGTGPGYGQIMVKAMHDLQKKPSNPLRVLQQDIHK